MAFTPTEEALLKLLADQNSALLNLAAVEPAIISKLGATKVTLSDLDGVTAPDDEDVMLARQGTDDKSIALSLLKGYSQEGAVLTTGDQSIAGVKSFSGSPIVPTVTAGDSSTKAASTAFVSGAVTSVATPNLFVKSNPYFALITPTSAFAAETAQDFYIEVDGSNLFVTSGTSLTMPGTPVVGTDYAIWVKPDGTLEATNNHTAPPITDAVRVGGIHYAPGGNATGVAGGNSTPALNPYSAWDMKFRINAPDPRGMALVADGVWVAIYMLNSDHIVNGPSRYGAAIADGGSPPRIPTQFGGNGSTSFSSFTWQEAALCLRAHGLRMPTYDEHLAYAYGVTEATSRGSNPGTIGLDAARTSKWGIMQATGNWATWGLAFGGPYASTGWVADTGGRGSTHYQPNTAVFSGNWLSYAFSGSGCADWVFSPPASNAGIGVRGVGDHLVIV